MSDNLYDPHPLLINSGTFWRCVHGKTGFANGFDWVGCAPCAADNPEGYARWHKNDKKKPSENFKEQKPKPEPKPKGKSEYLF